MLWKEGLGGHRVKKKKGSRGWERRDGWGRDCSGVPMLDKRM